jgi:hypothetical protein
MLDFKNKYLASSKDQPLIILDLGSQDVNGTYRDIFSVKNWVYKGMDMEPGKNVDIVLKEPYSWKEISSNSVPKYTDSSNEWLDTVLICRKGRHSWLLSLKHQLWRYLVHKLSVKGV